MYIYIVILSNTYRNILNKNLKKLNVLAFKNNFKIILLRNLMEKTKIISNNTDFHALITP